MSIERRNSADRRTLVEQGRARLVMLAAGTAVLGGSAGVAVPALADNAVSPAVEKACADPARTEPTVTVDGQVVDCDALAAQNADNAGDTTGDTGGETGAPEPTKPPEPADEAAPPATPPTDPAAAPTPTPTATPTPAATPAPTTSSTPASKPGSSDAKTTGTHDSGDDSADTPDRTTSTKHSAGAKAERRARARAKAQAERELAAQLRAKRKRDRNARAEAASARAAAMTYASLPAEWTSLAPITLPAYGVDDFPIPPFLLPIYQAAAAQYGVPWEVLASINEIETDFGRNTSISSAGALGWMQFIPTSWDSWGTDGDGDGRRDPRHPVDAIFAAANYLHEAGAQTDLPKAIYAYNHADWYVNRVVQRAQEFASLDKTMVAALSERALREDSGRYLSDAAAFTDGTSIKDLSPGQALLLSKRALTKIVLESDTIHVYEAGRRDIAAGRIDRRVLATLVFLDRSGMAPTVSSLFSGHSRYTTSGNISAHSYGHAVDIAAINGTPILGHQGAGSITETALRKLIELQGYLRPNQIITLMTIDGQDNTLALGDHDDHIHVGFPRVPRVSNGDRPEDVARHAEALRRQELRQRTAVLRTRRSLRRAEAQATTSLSLRLRAPAFAGARRNG